MSFFGFVFCYTGTFGFAIHDPFPRDGFSSESNLPRAMHFLEGQLVEFEFPWNLRAETALVGLLCSLLTSNFFFVLLSIA